MDSEELEIFKAIADVKLPLPFVKDGIAAGVFSTAENWLEPVMDLNETVIKNPASTYFGKIRGKSLEEAFLYNGDLLVIDRDYQFPKNYDLIVCVIEGKAALRYYKKEGNSILLKPANHKYQPIILRSGVDAEDIEVKTLGKVTWIFTGEENYKARLKHFDMSR